MIRQAAPAEFEGLRAPGTGPTDPHPKTRKRMPMWDRIKFTLLLVLIYAVLVWYEVVSYEPIMTIQDAMFQVANNAPWIFVLLGLEIVRQIHFRISESSAGYHQFWTQRVFGGFERYTRRRFSDWSRFRLARVLKWLFFIAIAALIMGEVLDTSPFEALFQAPALLWQALPYALQLAFAFFFIAFQFIGLFWLLSRGGVETYYPDDIKTRFTDVWGQDHVVERVKENIVFLEKPDEIEAKGGYVPSGLLLWGPPGTGKTLMAEAVAGETGKPYVFVDPGAFVNMFMGIGILKVKSLFRKLRKLALRYGGVIVFFDEADSLGRRGRLAQQGPSGTGRGFGASPAFQHAGCHGFGYLSPETQSLLTAGAAHGGAEEPGQKNRFFMGGNMMGGGGDPGTLQALLTELSGLKKPRGLINRYVRRLFGMQPKPPPKYRILVMMATNMPDALDEALLRPGRIDRIYKVGYPSKAGRIRTYQGYFDKVRHELTDEHIDKLATITPYATGATIKDLVNESLIIAIREGREVITWQDVMKAKRLKQLGPPEDVEYIERERHAVAVHEACHAVVAYRTRFHLEIDIATIEKGADYLGMVSSIKPEDQFTRWKSEHEADIMVSLASLAGERMFFGDDNSSGVSGDLHSATYLTALMEAYWGMGSGITSLPALQELSINGGKALGRPGGSGGGTGFLGDPTSRNRDDFRPDALGERIEYNLVRLLEKTEELLRENRREVLCLAHALETHKTLNGDDVVAVIEGSRGTVVDGSIYDDDDFFAEIEEYHEEAVRAHREHDRVSRALPERSVLVGALEPAGIAVHGTIPPGTPGIGGALGDSSGWSGSGQAVVLAPPTGQPAFVAPPPATSAPLGNGVSTTGASVTLPGVSAAPPAGGEAARNGAPAVPGIGTPSSTQPEFVPWAGERGSPVPPVLPGEVLAPTPEPAPRKHGARVLWVVLASIVALVAFTLLGTYVFTSPGAAGGLDGPPLGMLALLLVIVVSVVVGVAIVISIVRGAAAERARAVRARDQAIERAQLLAAAMDPDVAMRLLGYDGTQPPGHGGPATPPGSPSR